MKRIMIIMTTEYGKNGISSVVNNLYNALDKDTLEIDFIFPNEPDQLMADEIAGNKGNYYVLSNRMSRVITYTLKLFKLVKDYDVIHVHGNSHTMFIELFASKLAKVTKRIAHAHSTKSNFPLIDKLLAKPFSKTVTEQIACGKEAGNFVFGKSKFTIINNGISLENYKYNHQIRLEYRKRYSFTSEDKILIQVGYFDGNKNQVFSVELLKLLIKIDNNYKLIFVGKGYNQSEAFRMVETYNLQDNVLFFGERNDISNIMSMADGLLLPSFYEGMPRVVIESQASDLISFVSSNVSPEINISGEVSFFSLNDEMKKIANNIDKSLSKNVNRLLHEQNKKLRNKGYEIKDVAKKLKLIYLES